MGGEETLIGLLGVAAGAVGGVLWSIRLRRETRADASAAGRETERLRDRLRALEEDLELRDRILSTLQDAVLLVTADGRVVYANDTADAIFEGSPTSRVHVLPLVLQEAAREALSRTEATVEVESGPPPRWLRATAVGMGSGNVLMVVRDVTGLRRLDSIRRDFVANASHELKTPAAAIQAAAETIRSAVDEDPGAVGEFAEQLEREALRMSRIVSDLLDLSRLESGGSTPDEVALDALAHEEVARFDAGARAAGLTLELEAHPGPRVRGSAKDLALLLRNLVDNAIRYTRPGGSVHVQVGPEGDSMTITVRDTGIGIPTRDLPRIFERFYRVDRARSRETGGTGLGLSIVKHVVDNHGGTIEAQSELGRGTTFTVRLPAAEGRGRATAMGPRS
jgi:signal transduction histidine kinase